MIFQHINGHNKLCGGFTLVETLLYIAILAVILTLVITSFYQILSSHSRNQSNVTAENEANFLMQKIAWAFSGAQTINQFSVASGTATLSISKYDSSDNPLVFTLSSGTLSLSRANGPPMSLSDGNTNVGNLTGSYTAASGSAPASLKISFSLAASSTDPNPPAAMFENEFSLRK